MLLKLQEEIDALTQAIEEIPEDSGLYLERGKRYYRQGQFGRALNDFVRAAELDESSAEARGYIAMIREILGFRNTDHYNV